LFKFDISAAGDRQEMIEPRQQVVLAVVPVLRNLLEEKPDFLLEPI
jgi:hypothetical protein